MTARKAPSPRSVDQIDPHVFAPNLFGDRDWRTNDPIECLHCPFPPGNAVHKSSEELVAELEPNPIADVDKRMTGESE